MLFLYVYIERYSQEYGKMLRRAHFCLYVYATWDDVKHIRHIISRGTKGIGAPV